MCVCVCVRVDISICICIYVYICLHTYIHSMHIHTCIRVYVCVSYTLRFATSSHAYFIPRRFFVHVLREEDTRRH